MKKSNKATYHKKTTTSLQEKPLIKTWKSRFRGVTLEEGEE